MTFFSNKSCLNRLVPVFKEDNQVRNVRTSVYSKFVFVPSIFNLFNYGTPAPLSLLETCRFFSRNFTFDSHRDLKLSRIQENVKFKYFSRSMDSFQGLFKTNFVFKDFSRLYEPCSKSIQEIVDDLNHCWLHYTCN